MAYKQYTSREQMERDGWKFSSGPELAPCRECSNPVEWAKSPKGKNIPMVPGSTQVHFDVCGEQPAPRPHGRAQAKH